MNNGVAIPQRDTWLAGFLALMYEAEFWISLTLTTGGLLVSGTPIRPEEFMRLSSEAIAEAVERRGRNDGPNLRAYFGRESDAIAERVRQSSEAWSALSHEFQAQGRLQAAAAQRAFAESAEANLPTFIHLKDATVYGAFPGPIRLPLWRGRLSEVTGWNFGEVDGESGPNIV